MRTTLNVDEKLLEDVMCLTDERDKGRAVNTALSEFIRRRRMDELRALLGNLDLDLDDWDEFRHSERAWPK